MEQVRVFCAYDFEKESHYDVVYVGDYFNHVKSLEARITTLEDLLSESEADVDYWKREYYAE